jgi:hypothetical protein
MEWPASLAGTGRRSAIRPSQLTLTGECRHLTKADQVFYTSEVVGDGDGVQCSAVPCSLNWSIIEQNNVLLFVISNKSEE